jgi:transposase-like protein
MTVNLPGTFLEIARLSQAKPPVDLEITAHCPSCGGPRFLKFASEDSRAEHYKCTACGLLISYAVR